MVSSTGHARKVLDEGWFDEGEREKIRIQLALA